MSRSKSEDSARAMSWWLCRSGHYRPVASPDLGRAPAAKMQLSDIPNHRSERKVFFVGLRPLPRSGRLADPKNPLS